MTKVNKSRGRKVWHITDFRKIFELSDDLRKKRPGPLTYTKSPVTLTAGSKDHDIKIWERLQQLKSRPERHLLRSVFEDLKCWAGLKTIKDRGYLVTTEGVPASYEYIAGQLKMEVKEVKQAMTLLGDIGLLERLTIRSRQCRTHPDSSGRSRTPPDKNGRKRKRLKKAKAKVKLKVNGKGKSNSSKKRQGKAKPNDREVPPSTTQPIKPQNSAKGGTLIPFASPSELSNTELLGDIAKSTLHRHNPEAKRFAVEIYQALKLPWEPKSEMCRRELGCFGSLWHKARGDDELWDRAVTEAKKIAKRKQNKKKGAVFCTVFENLAASNRRRKVNGM